MRRLRAVLWAAATLPVAAAAGTPTKALHCGEALMAHSLRSAEIATLTSAEAGTLQIRELGTDLVWANTTPAMAPVTWMGVDLRPPRLGETWIPLAAGAQVQVRSLRTQQARFAVRLVCASALTDDARCVARLEAALRAKDQSVIDAAAASGGQCAVFAALDQANRAATAGQYELAHANYLAIAQMWAAHAVADRSAAALLGVAEQSVQAGYSARAIREAVLAAERNRSAGIEVYAVRASVTHALALRLLGRVEEARQLWLTALADFERLGEFNEVANIHFNLAAAAQQLSDWPEFERQMAAIATLEASVQTPVVQARIAQLRAKREIAAGRYPQALAYYDQAIRISEDAAVIAMVVTARQGLADLYRTLGMFDEARSQLARALDASPSSEAPLRTASILMSLAALDLDEDRLDAAQRSASAAETSYRLLRFPIETQWAQTLRLTIDLRRGKDPAVVIAELKQLRQQGDAAYERTCATMANAATALGRSEDALRELDDERCHPRTLDMSLQQAQARALATAAAGDRDLAQQQVLDYSRTLGQLLQGSNSAVRYAALRRLHRLRSVWLEIERQRDEPADQVRRAFTLALATQAHQSHPAAAAAGNNGASASTAIGNLLLADDPRNAAQASAAVLKRLTHSSTRTAAATADPSLAEVQATLAPEQWLLLTLNDARGGLALWISRDEAHAVPIAAEHVLRELLGRLLAQLDSPATPGADVNAVTREFSAALLSGAPMARPPSKLWVLSDELIGSAPLSLLQWPGGDAALLDSTELSWITRIAASPDATAMASTEPTTAPEQDSAPAPAAIDRAEPAGAQVYAVVAANTGNDATDKLSPLMNADYEPQLIAAAQPTLRMTRRLGANASPSALIDALQQPGAIVHLAAHGIAKPGLLGYAGVWLAPAPGSPEPAFLSWLDLADLALKAELAVLNACQLAAGPSVTRQSSLSFAAAIADAGVANVVAAAWPISDAATSTWIPAFYHALDASNPDSSAAALRAAQQTLRRSRHFRHPYYWASLAVWRQLNVGARRIVGIGSGAGQ